jgi:glycosyltransferase involved in cell wall biosynthesis
VKRLSICIPTFNRAVFLAESLEAIRDALELVDTRKVEIVISDNCSDDLTQQVIQKFVDLRLCEVKNFTQKENIGWSNLIKVTDYAIGDYIWILSDDDLILRDSILKILSLIESSEEEISIIVNIAAFDSRGNISKAFLNKNSIVTDFNSGLKLLGRHITFLSSVVFGRNNLDGEMKKISENNGFPQSFVFLKAMRASKIFFLREVCLKIRRGNSGGYNFYVFFITMIDQLLLFALKLGYSNGSVISVRNHVRLLLYWSVFANFEKNSTLRSSDIKKIEQIIYTSGHDFLTKITLSGFVRLFIKNKFVAKPTASLLNYFRAKFDLN